MAGDGPVALLAAAAPRSARAHRHAWLVQVVRWVHAGDVDRLSTPLARLKLLLDRLDADDEARNRVRLLLARFWHEVDLAALFADFGFTARRDLWGELAERLGERFLPETPDTDDMAQLFRLMFGHRGDPGWLADLDPPSLARLTALIRPDDAIDWRGPLLRSIQWLAGAIGSAGLAPALRQRMSAELIVDRPFERLESAAQRFADAVTGSDDAPRRDAGLALKALLRQCRRAADSVTAHLEDYGVSVHIVFEQEQLRARCDRVEAVMGLLLADDPAPPLCRLLAEFVALAKSRRRVGAVIAHHYSLLARKVAERHAEAGEHYITRNSAEFRSMLASAAGGGAAIGLTTFAKFAVSAAALAPFWSGLAAGLNYAAFFVVIHLMHWTVATKQPAMTAPAMADRLADLDREGAVEGFVDEVAHLVRSQFAGIVGNLAAVVPMVVALQALAWLALGRPLVGPEQADYTVGALTLLGPTALFAAFTGVLLFASSLIAGWTENWFVYHRLDSALAWHPDVVARLGADRAARWARWWRTHISSLAGNVSLGLMLGMVPPLLGFVGIGIDVRHVTLGAGQLAAAASTLGWPLLHDAAFWWCVAGVAATGALNVAVSFWLALHVAMRSRGIAVADRRRLDAAILRRARAAPLSFLWPR